MHVYMANYVFGTEESALQTIQVLQSYQQMSDYVYPRWTELKQLVEDVTDQMVPAGQKLNFQKLASVIGVVSDRFFELENKQCQVLKSTLIGMGDRKGSGRVRLADFYRPALVGGEFQFTETVDYLRESGALDESDAGVQRVIIPNYLHSFSNCLNSSTYYAVCCMNECEQLIGQLESKIQAPSAPPSMLLHILADFQPASQTSNRSFSPELRGLLDEVAQLHGGHVPLHGRLFAQWMHYAYPNECPFPHLSGTIKPRDTNNQDVIDIQDELLKQLLDAEAESQKGANEENATDDGLCSNMWSLQEELVDPEGQTALNGVSKGLPLWERLGRLTVLGVMAFAVAMLALAKDRMISSSCKPKRVLYI